MLPQILLVIVAAVTLAGCQRDERPGRMSDASSPPRSPAAQATTFTGTLRGGMMAIGGETTGWTLVGDAQSRTASNSPPIRRRAKTDPRIFTNLHQ